MTDLVERSLAARLVMIGRQGSGKGEQCGRLAQRLQLDHVSTGELLRSAVRAGSTLGRTSEAYVVRGEPVPDHIVAGIVSARIAEAQAGGRGVVLDGFPRTVRQAERLSEMLAPASIDLAIHLDVPRATAVERIQNRRECPSCRTATSSVECPICRTHTERRADDWPAAIGRRMSDFAREMGPLLEWYAERGVLETVDGVGTPAQVAERVANAVDRRICASVRSR